MPTPLFAAAAAVVLALSGAEHFREPTARLVVGPVLNGSRVIWGEQDDAAVRLRAAGVHLPARTIYAAAAPNDQHGVSLGALAASRERIAFRVGRSFCRHDEPNVVFPCVGHAEVFATMTRGLSFVRLGETRPCKSFAPFSRDDLDISGTSVVSLESYCRQEDAPLRRRIVRYGRNASAVLRDEESVLFACCGGIQSAGGLVAWADRSSVVVYDSEARRFARRISFRAGTVGAVAVQSDGSLAVVHDCRTFCRVSSYSRFGGRTLPLAIQPRNAVRVRMADDRVVVERSVAGERSELVISDLRGRSRRLARFSRNTRRVGDFDFDGDRVAWAQERVTSSTLDCPPPGVGRPCFWRDTGIRTIWQADVRTRPLRPRLVARAEFRDLLRVGG